ncbi:methionine ABC transporter substrate-binding protein [Streptobacillus felis]|uniref:Methionine ABC transporter substrate-binding protein n=1 Tax=Streptobacillus felis TaxID=1384509 RepID=A0A7Z0PH94_9FUSO|nr:MetQ/NlpA family ABC transporter substrate-binding protein [Streptobacillus felis]NYV28215.1 methionine ABC transporter substrate-binding protein [Streptobacillus felis]
MFKKLLFLFLTFVAISCTGGKSTDAETQKLVLGVSPIPHQEIVEFVKEDLKAEGIDLEIVVFNDYVQPNISLKDGSIDANYFQHVPYMESFGKENNIEMVSAGGIHLEPLKAYSESIKDINEIQDGSGVLIPNDPTNRGRALLLLDEVGLIKLSSRDKLDADVSDIVENSKNLVITSLNSEQIAPRLSEVALAVINTNNALAAGVTKEKAVIVEGKDSPYVNIITVLKGNENDERVQKLVKVLQSDKVKQFIAEKYNGEVEVGF